MPVQLQPLAFAASSDADVDRRAAEIRSGLAGRRTVRDFSARPIARETIEHIVMTAAGAPSGANQQPWHFVCINDREVKRKIRRAAEEEEKAFYAGRAGQDWLDALDHLGTDWRKPFLEEAPWLIAVCGQRYSVDAQGQRTKHYYMPESVGIACGFLITAIHQAGLASLTHTPAPMGFLNQICARPEHEKALILLVVGHPAEGCQVPVISKKPLAEVASFIG